MSSQDAIAGSDELKSRPKGGNPFISAFRFDHTGSLKDRLLTALIVLGAALALTIVALLVPYGRVLAVAWASSVAVLSVFEVVRLFARDRVTSAYQKGWGAIHFCVMALPAIVATVVGVQAVMDGALNWKLLFISIVASSQLLMILQTFAGRSRLEDGSRHAESYAPAFLLVGICAPQLIVIASLPLGVHLVWWLVGVVALNDAGAYFAGKYLGKKKMAPALSPNKTIEGSVAGYVIGIVAGVLLGHAILGCLLSTAALAFVSFVVVISAQAADLSKSYLKRLRGVKDTGAFFPGHGGVLDRFDGMIGAAPAVVLTLLLLGAL
jgi:phosphatidate cytidylyltransferase